MNPTDFKKVLTRICNGDEHLCRDIPANTLIALQRLHSLALGFGTFAYAKDRASLPYDGLLKDNPTPCSENISRCNRSNATYSTC
ncbi:MAG: hypothetical protein A4E63_00746 [Syntrophorhabdus sp. PtaU1.Bin050]|nr:MAG: hypothetical protein A4E63_00746 [Syntrophorhabdus sp. PtaU1.Bin050]